MNCYFVHTLVRFLSIEQNSKNQQFQNRCIRQNCNDDNSFCCQKRNNGKLVVSVYICVGTLKPHITVNMCEIVTITSPEMMDVRLRMTHTFLFYLNGFVRCSSASAELYLLNCDSHSINNPISLAQKSFISIVRFSNLR